MARTSIVNACTILSPWTCVHVKLWIVPNPQGLTFIVATTPSAILRQAVILSTASNKGSLSSCKSLLYVEGRPLSVMTNPVIFKDTQLFRSDSAVIILTFPNILPDFPRKSSSESGFFFCGMMLEPVLKKETQICISKMCTPVLTYTHHSKSQIRIRL